MCIHFDNEKFIKYIKGDLTVSDRRKCSGIHNTCRVLYVTITYTAFMYIYLCHPYEDADAFSLYLDIYPSKWGAY